MAEINRTWTGADRWTLVEGAFDALGGAYNAGRFIPLLEADVAGYVYFAIVTKLNGDATRVHLDNLYRVFEPEPLPSRCHSGG